MISIFESASPDPHWLGPILQDQNRSTSGKTLVSTDLDPGQRTAIIVGSGQSNMANYTSDGAYVPTQSNIDNFNIYDGACYAASEPLMGCGGPGVPAEFSNVMIRVADLLIEDGVYDRVILVPIAVGSSQSLDWAYGGVCHHRIGATVSRLTDRGLTPTHMIWQQEGDAFLGVSEADHYARLTSMINTWKGLTPTMKIFIALATRVIGVVEPGSPESIAIRTAQAAVVDDVTVFQGADTDTIGESGRNGIVHFNGAGAMTAAELWRDAIVAAE